MSFISFFKKFFSEKSIKEQFLDILDAEIVREAVIKKPRKHKN